MKKRGNKFAQSILKHCITDFITQNALSYIQQQSLSIVLGSCEYGGWYIISIFLGTFKFLTYARYHNS
nr:hypothetical protein [Wolbachia endosymbiont of Litomosoides brasiliensis]